MKNIFEQLADLLKKDERLVSQDGILLKNQTQELARKNDPALLKLLLSDKALKQHFFFEVEKTLIFDKEKFIRFVSNKQFLPDSYTAFKNKIGLTAGDEYVSENKEVVLAWPYKDCVLEGGMTKEDQKRDEIFYNETLAPDDINRLLDAKVFTSFKRIDKKGEHKLDGFNRDEKGTIKDNLIIKGNNLLALASLKKEFAGKVKLIYIDPPYNRDNERNDFLYNDAFKHSTWLVFVRNRLEEAKKLLSKEGVIWISISDNEGHYLKVLCDEVFDRENFVADVIWNSTKSVTNTAVISDAHTHNLLYAKDINWLKKNRTEFRIAANEAKFSNPDNDPRGKWVADPFQVGGIRPNQLYPIKNSKTGEVYKPLPGNSWKNEKSVFDELLKDGRIVFGVSGEAGPQRKRFWTEAKERGEVTTTLWDDLPTTTNATRHLKDLFGEKVFDNPKPEGLIQRIIELSTKEGDLVLDFFAGSGTTASTALKMKRQFITTEQMDYVDNVTIERIKKVIAGEQGGISKSVNWKDGGDFVYMELAAWNEKWVKKIRDVKTGKELAKLCDEMKETAFLSYKVDPKTIDANAKDFADLSIADQKKFLIECLDKNQLYINLSEIEDKEYGVSKEDIKLNKEFYGSKS
ncbi:site-specific DNA-methyltransferase [Patescibacteria group bacterium]|nr:site-specific DNA-methyltransferase [Patescibacteria group bacterium]